MYIPEHFREEKEERLQVFIRENAFGVLVSMHEGLPFASHLPFLFEPSEGPHGKLSGHMARANPHWQSLGDARQALTIFHGPHAYVSPSWYNSPGVPTWNYVAVHVYGKSRLIEDRQTLWDLATTLTTVHESRYEPPWEPDLPDNKIDALLGMIIGFEIEITDIQGKFKLSQNRPSDDRKRIIQRLEQEPSNWSTEIARLMESQDSAD